MKTEHWFAAAGLALLFCSPACDGGGTDDGSSNGEDEGEDDEGSSESGEESSSGETGSESEAESGSEESESSSGEDSETSAIDYENDIQPIWDESCTGASCHSLFPPVLDPGGSYDAIVDGDSLIKPDMVWVSPGSADDSFLYIKITDGEGIVGAPMPSGEDPLPQDQIDLIRDWIDAGAPE